MGAESSGGDGRGSHFAEVGTESSGGDGRGSHFADVGAESSGGDGRGFVSSLLLLLVVSSLHASFWRHLSASSTARSCNLVISSSASINAISMSSFS